MGITKIDLLKGVILNEVKDLTVGRTRRCRCPPGLAAGALAGWQLRGCGRAPEAPSATVG